MKNDEPILTRQTYTTKFKNEDMDFTLNWAIGVSQMIGLSASQILYAVHDIKDGDPVGWCRGFARLGASQLEDAERYEQSNRLLAGQAYMGAAFAFHMELSYVDPTLNEYRTKVAMVEKAFIKGAELLHIPMGAIAVPFEDVVLPGYYLEQPEKDCPTLVMIGGGDTSREDLFYFAGYPGWKRGYNVLMVDLPGQGKLPSIGQTFRVDMEKPIRAAIDWLEVHAAQKPQKIALYGVSGGGYFTAQAVASDPRINAWIASTPITDIAQVFRKEFGNALKAPGWVVKAFMKVVGKLNKGAAVSLKKYSWQFGTSDFRTAIDKVFAQAVPVKSEAIACPSLFLLGESEAPELVRQTEVLYHELKQRGVDVTMRSFTAIEGADAHCQVNNYRLAHLVIFNWLDTVFGYHQNDGELDSRIVC